MSEFRENLKREFQDEDYRYAYDEEFANSRMATQIKVIRQQRKNMTQVALAELTGMKQSRISALENINYSAWSINTLRRIARALGVRFVFKFESWGELLHEAESFGRDTLEKPDFEHDPAFQASVADTPKAASAGAAFSARSGNAPSATFDHFLEGRKGAIAAQRKNSLLPSPIQTPEETLVGG